MHPFVLTTGLIMGLGLSAVAQTEPVHILTQDPHVLVKDWKAAEVTDALLQTQVCQASTTASQGPVAVEFSVNLPKTQQAPPYVLLKVFADPAPAAALVKMDSKNSHPLLPLTTATEPQASTSYLYIPLDLPKLYAKIRDEVWLDLMLDPKGTPVPVRISLKGSAATLRELAKCLGTSSVVLPTEYLKLLNTAETTVSPDVTQSTTPVLFDATVKAFTAYLQGKNLQTQLAKLQKDMAALVKSENTALKAFNDVDGRMVKLVTRANDSRQKLATAQAALTTSQDQLKQLEADKIKADADLAAKEALYRPLLEQLKPFNERIKVATAKRDRHATEVRRLERIISQNPGAISSRRNEQSQLTSEISSLDSQIDRLAREEDRAEDNMRRYNIEHETRQILQSDWQFRRLQDEIRDHQRNLQNAQHNERQKRQELDRARRDLDQCRRQPAVSIAPLPSGTTVANPPPPQPADCSAQENQFRSAEREFTQASQQVRQIERNMQHSRWQLDRVEDSARSTAQREYDRLRREFDNAASATRSAENRRSNARSRHQQLSSEIQSLQSDLSTARSNLPGQQSALDQAKLDLTEATRARDELSTQIGFADAESAYQAAVAHLANLVKSISAKKSEITKISAQIKSETTLIADLDKQIEKLRPSHTAALTKLQGIQAQLKPSRDEESRLNAEIAARKATLDLQRANYQRVRTDLLAAL